MEFTDWRLLKIIATMLINGLANPDLNQGNIAIKAGHEVVYTSAESFRVRDECGLRFIPSL